jgi:tetratricopeptide (TPR) repeat protein
MRLGNREAALATVARAIAANPDNTVALCNQILFGANDGSDDHRLRVLKEAKALEVRYPQDLHVAHLLGNAHYDLGQWDQARLHYGRVIEGAGPNAFLLEMTYPRAITCEKRYFGGDTGAAAALDMAIRATRRLPRSTEVSELLGRLARREPLP